MTIPSGALAIIDALESAGHRVYMVGGCVRDALLHKKPHDWDICTSAKPDDMQRIFKDFKLIETGLKHGTLTVMAHGFSYEVTTFRIDDSHSEHSNSDHASYAADLLTDLSRRDFTINAMAYSPCAGLIDPFGGRFDLERHIIRCVGSPTHRFTEDPLRVLRALRFASVLSFDIDGDTAEQVHTLKDSLKLISPERIASEMKKLLVGKCVERILRQYTDVFCVIIPEIRPCIEFNPHNPCLAHDIWAHTIDAVSKAMPDLIVRLTLLLHDLGKPSCFTIDENGSGHSSEHAQAGEAIARSVLRRLKFDSHTVETVSLLVGLHDAEILVSMQSVRKLLGKIGVENARLLLEVRRADACAQALPYPDQTVQLGSMIDEIIAQAQCINPKDLQISGHDIIELGVQPGKGIGMIRSAIFEKVINGEIRNERSVLIAMAKAMIDE